MQKHNTLAQYSSKPITSKLASNTHKEVDIAILKRPFKTSKTNFNHGQTKARQKVAKIDLIPVTGRPEKINEHTQQIAVLQYQMNIMYQV